MSTAAPSTVTTPRRPLSLRELFCLVTLACVVAGLVFSRDLNRDEQWLLGGAAGGTLLGILLGRAAARRAWLWGPMIGVLATCGAASMLQLGLPEEFTALSPSEQESASENYYPMQLASLAVGLAIVAATTAVELLLVGLLSLRPRSWSPPQRRGAVLTMLIASVAMLAVLFSDRVPDPHAWRAKRVIVLPERVIPMPNYGLGWFHHALVLSAHGKWVAVMNCDVDVARYADEWETTRVYRIDGAPCPPLVASNLRHATVFAFSPDERSVAFVSEYRNAQVMGLVDGQERSCWSIDDSFDEMHWLPSGLIAMTLTEMGASNPGPPRKSVLQVFEPTTGRCMRDVSGQQVVTVNARLGHEYRRDWSQVQVHDPSTGELIKTVRSGHADQTIRHFQFPNLPIYEFEAASNLAYAFTTTENSWNEGERYCLLDLHDGSRRPLQETPATFTRSGQLLTYTGVTQPEWPGSEHWYWVAEVPLVWRVYNLLQTDRVRAIDPSSGEESAHTDATWGRIQRLALSHDGGTMAVLTERRVYVYDVPEGFR